MAYRVKGFLTLKQREAAMQFIHNYYALIASDDTGTATKEMVQAVMYPWALLLQAILFADNYKMIEKEYKEAR